MLASLHKRLASPDGGAAKHLTAVCADMRNVRLDQRFDLVLATFNTVLHLYTRGDMEAFLRTARDHLEPDGALIFDFSAPRMEDLALCPDEWLPAGSAVPPGGTRAVPYSERFRYERHTQILRMDLRFDTGGSGTCLQLSHRQYFPQEMEALLHYNGFPTQRWYADFDWQPASPQADSLCLIAGRAGPLKWPDLPPGA